MGRDGGSTSFVLPSIVVHLYMWTVVQLLAATAGRFVRLVRFYFLRVLQVSKLHVIVSWGFNTFGQG